MSPQWPYKTLNENYKEKIKDRIHFVPILNTKRDADNF